MPAADTNVLLHLLVRDDPAQAAAAEAFVAAGAWASQMALAETAWVLQTVYRRRPAALAAALELLLDANGLTIENPGVVRAALATFRRHPRLGFTDCLLVAQARAAGHQPLGTFDRALARLPGAHPLTPHP
jgi:predicted nucleic-acid-binding protein